MSTGAQRSGDISSIVFCLETKEPIVQGSGFLGCQSVAPAKRFKLDVLDRSAIVRIYLINLILMNRELLWDYHFLKQAVRTLS